MLKAHQCCSESVLKPLYGYHYLIYLTCKWHIENLGLLSLVTARHPSDWIALFKHNFGRIPTAADLKLLQKYVTRGGQNFKLIYMLMVMVFLDKSAF